jgi:hypothetical protein
MNVASAAARARAFRAWADEYEAYRPAYPGADTAIDVPVIVDCWLAPRSAR